MRCCSAFDAHALHAMLMHWSRDTMTPATTDPAVPRTPLSVPEVSGMRQCCDRPLAVGPRSSGCDISHSRGTTGCSLGSRVVEWVQSPSIVTFQLLYDDGGDGRSVRDILYDSDV